MLHWVFAAFTALFLVCAPAEAQDNSLHLILSLEQVSDDTTVQSIELFANDIDPNSSASDDRYTLLVNGHTVRVSDRLLARLDHERRGYSYDHFTHGISDETAQAVCMMAGPAQGTILSVRYLTYADHQITSHAMRPILSRADNCLYTRTIRPRADHAHAEAIRAMAMLQTLLELHGHR